MQRILLMHFDCEPLASPSCCVSALLGFFLAPLHPVSITGRVSGTIARNSCWVYSDCSFRGRGSMVRVLFPGGGTGYAGYLTRNRHDICEQKKSCIFGSTFRSKELVTHTYEMTLTLTATQKRHTCGGNCHSGRKCSHHPAK